VLPLPKALKDRDFIFFFIFLCGNAFLIDPVNVIPQEIIKIDLQKAQNYITYAVNKLNYSVKPDNNPWMRQVQQEAEWQANGKL
jgi:hypothetical protein